MRRIPLLDLGNVVVKVDFTPFLQWLTERSGDHDPSRAKALLSSSLFFDFEFGHLSPEAFAKRVASHFNASFSPADLEAAFCGIFPGMVDGADEALSELASAGPLYCLSNTNKVHLSYLHAHFPALQKFTRIFASHEMQSRKPYPGIFHRVAEAIEASPHELVFFDDLAANVEGAQRAGLEAHLFTDISSMMAVLQKSPE